jgi:hypothetical protein
LEADFRYTKTFLASGPPTPLQVKFDTKPCPGWETMMAEIKHIMHTECPYCTHYAGVKRKFGGLNTMTCSPLPQTPHTTSGALLLTLGCHQNYAQKHMYSVAGGSSELGRQHRGPHIRAGVVHMGSCAHGQHGNAFMQAATRSCATGQQQRALQTGSSRAMCMGGVTGSSAYGQHQGAAHMGSCTESCTWAAAWRSAHAQQQGACRYCAVG